MWVAFFSKKFQHICVSLDVNFNESLTNDVVSFEQLGPELFSLYTILQKAHTGFQLLSENVGKLSYLSLYPTIYRHIESSYITRDTWQILKENGNVDKVYTK